MARNHVTARLRLGRTALLAAAISILVAPSASAEHDLEPGSMGVRVFAEAYTDQAPWSAYDQTRDGHWLTCDARAADVGPKADASACFSDETKRWRLQARSSSAGSDSGSSGEAQFYDTFRVEAGTSNLAPGAEVSLVLMGTASGTIENGNYAEYELSATEFRSVDGSLRGFPILSGDRRSFIFEEGAGEKSFSFAIPMRAAKIDERVVVWPAAFAMATSGGRYPAFPERSAEFTATIEVCSTTPGVVVTSVAGASCGDRDGDGLLDSWETGGIDGNGDGKVDLDLRSLGADRNHKDVFVEVDYMADERPGESLDDVATAFRRAPVENPDGRNGITLHAELDEAVATVAKLRFESGPAPLDDFDDIKLGAPAAPCDGSFGTAAQRADVNCEHVLAAKALVYRYALVGHESVPGAMGWGEQPGNDFLITVGGWSADLYDELGGRRAVEATTFMHELGHNLGLKHGGRDEIDCKPNYLSVMNANTALPFLSTPFLDYSRAALPSLDETALSEPDGLRGPAGGSTIFGIEGEPFYGPTDGALNWNGNDLATETGLELDINHIDAMKENCPPSPGQPLHSFDDWVDLQYRFQTARDFAPRVHSVHSTPDIGADEALAMTKALSPGETVPPVTSAATSPAAIGGWHRTDVTVQLTAADEPRGSGVKEIVYSLGGAETTVAGSSAQIVLSSEGATTLTYFARDNAGNAEEPKTLVVRIDRTPPMLVCSVSPTTLWPPNHKLAAVTTSVRVTDSLSGASAFTLVGATSNEPDRGLGDGDTPGDIQGWTIGSADTSGQLRAERSGAGDGRVYTLRYEARDRAGNVGSCDTRVAVPHSKR